MQNHRYLWNEAV